MWSYAMAGKYRTGEYVFQNADAVTSIKVVEVFSALIRLRNKIKRPDARIAFAMPPRIGTNIMMAMREDTHHGIGSLVTIIVVLVAASSSIVLCSTKPCLPANRIGRFVEVCISTEPGYQTH